LRHLAAPVLRRCARCPSRALESRLMHAVGTRE